MSLGQTASAPASTCETAVRAISSSDSSFRHLAVADDAAVAVRRVLAEADVGEQQQLREPRPQRAQRALDDPVVVPRAGALLVLLLRDPEQDHRARRRAARARRTSRTRSSTVWRAMRGQLLVRARASGATKSGITKSSRSSFVSRTSAAERPGAAQPAQPRGGKGAHGVNLGSAAVSRARPSAVPGRSRPGPRVAVLPRLELDPDREELPDRAPGGERRQRDEHARQPVDLAAGEQPEDHEQRMQSQRVPHHLRDHDVALDLVDREEEQHDPDGRQRVDDQRVEDGRDRAEPRAEVGDQLGDGDPRAEEERVRLEARRQPTDRAEQPQPDARARADDRRHEQLALHVAADRASMLRQQRRLSWCRREAPVDRAVQPVEVEEHVDRHDEHEHEPEEEARRPRAPRPRPSRSPCACTFSTSRSRAGRRSRVPAARSGSDRAGGSSSQSWSRSTSRSAPVSPVRPFSFVR